MFRKRCCHAQKFSKLVFIWEDDLTGMKEQFRVLLQTTGRIDCLRRRAERRRRKRSEARQDVELGSKKRLEQRGVKWRGGERTTEFHLIDTHPIVFRTWSFWVILAITKYGSTKNLSTMDTQLVSPSGDRKHFDERSLATDNHTCEKGDSWVYDSMWEKIESKFDSQCHHRQKRSKRSLIRETTYNVASRFDGVIFCDRDPRITTIRLPSFLIIVIEGTRNYIFATINLIFLK